MFSGGGISFIHGCGGDGKGKQMIGCVGNNGNAGKGRKEMSQTSNQRQRQKKRQRQIQMIRCVGKGTAGKSTRTKIDEFSENLQRWVQSKILCCRFLDALASLRSKLRPTDRPTE